MNIIVCEGKTDAILISHFLIKTCNYNHTLKGPFNIKVHRENEEIYWYIKNEKHKLAIWAAGGYDKIKEVLKDIVERNEVESEPEKRFDRLALYFDRDNRTQKKTLTNIANWLKYCKITATSIVKIDGLTKCSMKLEKIPREDFQLFMLVVVLPPDGQGSLETFLLNSLHDSGPSEKEVVDKSRIFIKGIPDEPYLEKNRLREKATLGSVLSVFSPDCVFSIVDKKLRSIKWDEIENVNNAFKSMKDFI